jgi:hypothetical protein
MQDIINGTEYEPGLAPSHFILPKQDAHANRIGVFVVVFAAVAVFWYWSLNSKPYACQASTLPPESCPQPCLL